MWHQFLSKLSATKYIDFGSCNMEHREQIKPSSSFESACKSDPIILDLSDKTLGQIDLIRHCIPGQFTKIEHLKAAYYDSPILDKTLNRWNNLVEIQTECTVRWLQSKFNEAQTNPNWNDSLWYNAQNERNNSEDSGVCDGYDWFKFVDILNIGPYITHPWTSTLSALIAKEIIKHIHNENNDNHTQLMNILDVGCGVGQFGTKLNDLINTEQIKLNIDGIDRSQNSLSRMESVNNPYRYKINMDLCNKTDIDDFKKHLLSEKILYDIIVSSDCLQMLYGNDYAPGSKAVQDLMDLVKLNGYFLIVNTLQTTDTYKMVCLYHDILKEKWTEHGFECIADIVVRGYGDLHMEYKNDHERNSIENNICFVKLNKRSSA